MNDGPERSSNRRSRNATVTTTSESSFSRNVEGSGEEHQREKDEDGRRQRRRSNSPSAPIEKKGKTRPITQSKSMIQPNTEDMNKKKDYSSKNEKHKYPREEGRSRASSLPNDETEKKSQRRSHVEPIAAEDKKRRNSQNVSYSTNRENRSGEGRSQTPSSSVPSSDTEKKSRHRRRTGPSMSGRKLEKSFSTSAGNIAIKREKHHSRSEEDLPQHPRTSLRNGSETEKKSRLRKRSEAGTVDKRLAKSLSSSTGDTAHKSERSNSRSEDGLPGPPSSSLSNATKKKNESTVADKTLEQQLDSIALKSGLRIAHAEEGLPRPASSSLHSGNETKKTGRRRSSEPGTVDKRLARSLSSNTGDRAITRERHSARSEKGLPRSSSSSLPSYEVEKKTRPWSSRGLGTEDRNVEEPLSSSNENNTRKGEKRRARPEEGLPGPPSSSLPSYATERKLDRKRRSEPITVNKKVLKSLGASTGDSELRNSHSEEGMPRPQSKSLPSNVMMVDSNLFLNSLSDNTGDITRESEKRHSDPVAVLSLLVPNEDDYIQSNAYTRNETRKNERRHSQPEVALSKIRKLSSRSMIHESERNAPPTKYALLRDQSTSDYSLVPRERSRLRDRPVSEPVNIHDWTSTSRVNFLKDDPEDMTFARRIALSLINKKWYNPKAGASGPSKEDLKLADNEEYAQGCKARVTKHQYPSLERAWAYFEHVSLPRFIAEPKPDAPKKNLCHRMIRKMSKANKSLDRAEPGESKVPTKLYSPIFTPLSQMGDFGLGIGLYFSTLRAMTVLTLLAGLINIPNLIYFSGPDYSESQPGVFPLLQGSAICTKQVWVPCPDCNENDFEDAKDRLAVPSLAGENGNTTNMTFALRNACEGATLQQGLVSFGTLFFIVLGIVAMNSYQKYREIKYDEDEQTAQDYSILITNPPPNATDPEEWRVFFREKFGAHTTVCTIAVDNDFLVRSLLERRECMQKIELLLEPGTSVDELNLARIAAQIERERSPFGKLLALVVPGIPELLGRVTILASRVQGLAQQDYPASNVFITFETEAAQRKVLSALSVGVIAASGNKTKVLSKTPEYLFRGDLLLNVGEPEEPSTVRWQDLNTKFTGKLKALLTTTLATIGAIALIALLIKVLNGMDATWAALGIAAFNGIFPLFAKLLTHVESHASESSRQTSLYFKIAAFRWVNTAIIITVITPFTKTLDNTDGLIRSIAAIFFADIVTTNAIQFLDVPGHFQRHCLAPRAATQDFMNLNMQGQEFELAERYTNMTKILFLTFWYCSIYPGTLFMCSFALFVNFFMDRFSLMRTWKRAPALGTTISKFSRRYFFSTALVAMAVVSSYYWAGFPFDNLCKVDGESLDPMYYGNWTVTTLGSGTKDNAIVTIFSHDVYKYCLQDLFKTSGRGFPAIPQFQPEGSEWMTQDQETVTTIYGWTSVGVLAIIALKFLWGWYQSFRGLFRSTYKPNGDDQEINFSDIPSISTYVPQVASKVFSYPLFACNIDGIDEELFEWTDPDRPHSYYDLTKDAEELLRGMDISHKHVFSTLSHWPPPDKASDDPYI